MRQNPGSQRASFEAVLRAVKALDSKFGTQLVKDFISNLKSGAYNAF
jgi:hypothetical protein